MLPASVLYEQSTVTLYKVKSKIENVHVVPNCLDQSILVLLVRIVSLVPLLKGIGWSRPLRNFLCPCLIGLERLEAFCFDALIDDVHYSMGVHLRIRADQVGKHLLAYDTVLMACWKTRSRSYSAKDTAFSLGHASCIQELNVEINSCSNLHYVRRQVVLNWVHEVRVALLQSNFRLSLIPTTTARRNFSRLPVEASDHESMFMFCMYLSYDQTSTHTHCEALLAPARNANVRFKPW